MITLLYNLHSSLQVNVLNQPQKLLLSEESKRPNGQKVNKQLTGIIVAAITTTTTTREEVVVS